MKAQYVGDIGDFGKVLLLKHLAGLSLKIGVNWVLTKNDNTNAGEDRGYAKYRGINCLCCCDKSLLECIVQLAQTKKSERKIADLENRSIRNDEAFKCLNPDVADLVFFDPDNGIGGDHGESPKHVYLPDLRRYWERGQSLMIYHHLGKRESHEKAIKTLTEQLQRFPNSHVTSYRFRRGTARVFLLCLQPKYIDRVSKPEDIETLIPMFMNKNEWAKLRRIKQESCIENHPWC